MTDADSPPPSSPVSPSSISYGRQAPLHRRRFFRRLIVGFAVMLALMLLVRCGQDKFTPMLALMREQRACLNYAMPDDLVVYDEMRQHPGYDYFRPGFGSSMVSYVSRPDPPLWSSLQSRLAPTIAWPDTPLAFLHGRRSSGAGHERFVAIELSGGSGTGPLVILRTYVFERPSVFQPFILCKSEIRRVRAVGDPLRTNSPFGSRDVRIFAGQPSAQDPSRFTIVVETEGRQRKLTGALRDDDTIDFDGGADLIVEPVKW